MVIDLVRALSPATALVPGPDGCLVNGEVFGGTYPLYHATSVPQSSYSCTDASKPLAGPYFAVVESDFSVTIPGWFWDPTHNTVPAAQLGQQFTLKAEQGANLILNVPPNTTGVVEDALLAQLAQFASARAAVLASPRAALPAPVAAPCAAISVTLPVSGDFDTVILAEDLVAGQVIGGYSLEVRDGASGAWRALSAGVHGVTVGLRLLDSVGLQRGVSALRFNCSSDLAPPPPSGGDAEVAFVNSAGQCLSIAENATWPCYTGSPVPGDGPFSLCPLLAAPCSAPGAAWTQGPRDHSLTAARVARDAVVNVDCDTCTPGTHANLAGHLPALRQWHHLQRQRGRAARGRLPGHVPEQRAAGRRSGQLRGQRAVGGHAGARGAVRAGARRGRLAARARTAAAPSGHAGLPGRLPQRQRRQRRGVTGSGETSGGASRLLSKPK